MAALPFGNSIAFFGNVRNDISDISPAALFFGNSSDTMS